MLPRHLFMERLIDYSNQITNVFVVLCGHVLLSIILDSITNTHFSISKIRMKCKLVLIK